MKKMIPAVLLCLSLLAGCAHQAVPWSADPDSHWQETGNGKLTGMGTHELDSFGLCAICGAEVTAFDDGSASVSICNERGEQLIWSEYDPSGSLTIQYRYGYEYDEAGNIIASKTYEGDRLIEEFTYRFTEYDLFFPLPATHIYYGENGSREYGRYDDRGNLISITLYDAAGQMSYIESYEIKYDSSGSYVGEKIYMNGVLTRETFFESAPDGWYYMVKDVYYDSNGEIESETSYDAQGNVIG